MLKKQQQNIKKERQLMFSYGQTKGCTVWFTGLSGAGKTTISLHLEELFVTKHIATYSLDGDNIRQGLNKNLSFSESDREENVRRVAEVARLFADAGFVCLCSLVSPYSKDRKMARLIHEKDNIPFFEIYVNTPLDVCEKRDVKGLYEKARKGIIKQFTGIDQPYEEPDSPDLILETVKCSVDEAVKKVTNLLLNNNIIKLKDILENNSDVKIVKELFVDESKCFNILKDIDHLPKLQLSIIDMQWLQVLSEGWAYPLNGFMREEQYLQTLHFNAIGNNDYHSNFISQSIPIVLAIDDQQKLQLEQNTVKNVSLWFNDECYALLSKYEIFPHRKEERCCRQFGTSSLNHPYVKLIYESGDWLIGGKLDVLKRIYWNDGLDEYRLTPNELQQKFLDLNADKVFAFQLRNPIHNGHALLMRHTRQMLQLCGYQKPILLLHPLGGWTKDDDVPLSIRIKQHRAVLAENAIDGASTVLAIFPSPMMYAGPTEVQWHAKARMNAGVNYYIVGRDPAGIPHPDKTTPDGNLYDPTHGAKILKMTPYLKDIQILEFKVAAYDKKNSRMDYFDPKRKDDFEFISGTKMREFARLNTSPPDGFMVTKAWQVLVEYYQSK